LKKANGSTYTVKGYIQFETARHTFVGDVGIIEVERITGYFLPYYNIGSVEVKVERGDIIEFDNESYVVAQTFRHYYEGKVIYVEALLEGMG